MLLTRHSSSHANYRPQIMAHTPESEQAAFRTVVARVCRSTRAWWVKSRVCLLALCLIWVSSLPAVTVRLLFTSVMLCSVCPLHYLHAMLNELVQHHSRHVSVCSAMLSSNYFKILGKRFFSAVKDSLLLVFNTKSGESATSFYQRQNFRLQSNDVTRPPSEEAEISLWDILMWLWHQWLRRTGCDKQ